MARFQFLGDFHGPGNLSVEAGTIIDGDEGSWPNVKLPLNAMALDESGLARLCATHHPDLWHRLRFAEGLTLPYSPHHAPGIQPKTKGAA